MTTQHKGVLLIVDDEEGIRLGLQRFFEKNQFRALSCGTVAEAVGVVREQSVACVILDVRLESQSEGLDLLETLLSIDPELPVIVITGYGRIDDAVEAMKRGARDYLLKPVDNRDLLRIVDREVEIARLQLQNSYLQEEAQARVLPPVLQETQSPRVRSALSTIDKVKDSDISVLIQGETGTGKEILAQYLHHSSARGDKPLVSLNCAALSEHLLLSELFGHEKGAFTGAIERRRGRFEVAHGGTLFLDEIGNMSLEAQGKLLRVLEESRFERLGGTQSVTVDVRVVTASNKSLSALVEEGRFRTDLYYRLHVVCVELPPLRERQGDIPLLVERFVQYFSSKHRKRIADIPEREMARLMSWRWPGNIRELRNVISQSVLLSDGPLLELHGFAGDGNRSALSSAITSDDTVCDLKSSVQRHAADYERKVIAVALERYGWNRSETARQLGITRKTLRDKMREYHIGGSGGPDRVGVKLSAGTG